MRRRLATLLRRRSLIGLVAAPAAAAACPQTNLPDLEDEVMCTVCGTTLGLATEAPQAQRERAFILDADRALRVEGPDQGGAGGRVRSRGAGHARGGGLRRGRVPRARSWSCSVASRPLRSPRFGRDGAGAWGRRSRASAGRRRGSPDIGAAAAARLDADLERYDL
ncbi:MAG: hypothetical protein WKF31_02815 [Thermoleophilaceae bacterium]